MAGFVTRVELHSATSEDYDKLHAQMDARGFRRTITGDNGKNYHLPSATYYVSSSSTIAEIRDSARAAATAIGKGSWIVTTEGNSSWYLSEA